MQIYLFHQVGPLDGERLRYLKLTLPSSTPSALETVVEWVKEARTAVRQRLDLQGVGRGIWGMELTLF